jgi:hypothetical protein
LRLPFRHIGAQVEKNRARELRKGKTAVALSGWAFFGVGGELSLATEGCSIIFCTWRPTTRIVNLGPENWDFFGRFNADLDGITIDPGNLYMDLITDHYPFVHLS